MAAVLYPQRSPAARALIVGALTLGLGAVTAPGAAYAASKPLPGEVAPALLAKIHLVGAVHVRLVVGTTVHVTGNLINTDKVRHDVYLKATVYDKHGKVVGHAQGKAEDIRAHTRSRYVLVGSVISPSFASARVKAWRVTENVPGETGD